MPGVVQVAWPAGRGYAARVSRLHFHRWAVIFLLMSKLILGELTHAMPHMAQDMDPSATAVNEIVTSASTSHDAPPCGNHVQQTGSKSEQSQDSSSDGHAAKSCCEGGECACPCLHSPAATAAVPFVMQIVHDDRAAVLVKGAAWHRLSGLFRPPAY
jgi:hypothetical protein